MSTSTESDGYVLGRTHAEYERLRAQARIWEEATGRVLDRVELARGQRCLDAGSGPGETMRLLAQRVGPTGDVVGIDVDADLGAQAIVALHRAGHAQCSFAAVDLEGDEPIPGGPYDLVYARLLLLHVHDRVAVLRRLWDAVAPGGRLVVHDYDLSVVTVVPELDVMTEWRRVVLAAFEGAGCDIRIGSRLPLVFAEAGIGAPDGTDVAGRLEPLRGAGPMLGAVHASMLPAAIAMGLTTPDDAERWRDDLVRAMAEDGDRPGLWPLLIGAWRRKEG